MAEFRPRVARPAPAAWNVTKTLLQIVVMWGTFFVALPYGVLELETRAGLAGWRFDSEAARAAAVVAFCVLGAVGVGTGLLMAVRGSGTPLPFDTARRLIVAGAYRHVRNPMAMTSLAQGAAVGVYLGSPLVLAYVLAGLLVWNHVARPWEERDLEARFGDAYVRYRRRVRCWRVRLRPYGPDAEPAEPVLAAERTTPPGRPVALYDGHCRFCTAGAERLARLAPPGAIELREFQQPGALDDFPGVPHAACMRAMHLVLPDGRVVAGAEAVARVLTTRPVLGLVGWAYYVPGLRLLCDVVYDWIARNRYRLFGRTGPPCDDDACAVHLGGGGST